MITSSNPTAQSKELTKKFFDNYYNKEISYNANEVPAR